MTTAQGRYGPQTKQVEALVARAATLTVEEVSRLAAAWATARLAARDAAAWDAAWDASWASAGASDRLAVWAAARCSAWLAVQASGVPVASWAAAWGAIQDAVLALAVRDLIDQAHYRALTAPWRSVIGPIHPDDTPAE